MRKKQIILVFIGVLFMVSLLLTVIIMRKRKWTKIQSSEGHYSVGTYLDSGSEYITVSKNIRIIEDFNIQRGSIRFIVKTIDNKEIINEMFCESGLKTFTFDGYDDVECEFVTEVSKDADIYCNSVVEKNMNRFDIIKQREEDKKAFNELFNTKGN